MNQGKFFSLDLDASSLNEGITVFNYTDIFDHQVVDGDKQITPRYPIFVSITSTSVKFILQYCVYLQNGNFKHSLKSTTQCDQRVEIRQMNEVLIELPITTTSGLSLASILKRLYKTPFPIEVKKIENKKAPDSIIDRIKRFFVEQKEKYTVSEKNYILECVKNRYESARNDYYKLKCDKDALPTNIHYSKLPIYELYDDKKKRYVLCDAAGRYNKVLRKLILDFFFDMMHSDVFKNSMHYDMMYERFMSDYFCSALIYKAEFYYQRALVNNLPKRTEAISIYAENLDIAEKHWVECIQSPLSDKHFEFQPKWYDAESNINNFRKIWSRLCNRFKRFLSILSPLYYFYLVDYWFASPEEELRRVYYRDKFCKIASSRHVPFFKFKGRVHLRNRSITSAKWFVKRYCFRDAYRMSFFWLTNTILLSVMIFFISYILELSWVSNILPLLESVYARLEPIILSVVSFCKSISHWILWSLMGLIGVVGVLMFRGKIFLFYPRLIAAITAAWFSITLGDNMFKAFFDQPWSKFSVVVLLLFIALFVYYEVHKIVPKLSWFRKACRTLELMVISFTISLVVGICTINFTGEKMLVRSGYLPNFYHENVLVHTSSKEGEPTYALNFSKISQSQDWNDSIVMNMYTYAPKNNMDSVQSILAVHNFANSPHGDAHMNRIEELKQFGSVRKPKTKVSPTDNAVRTQFLIRHENSELFKDLLPYVEHDDGHSVAKFIPLWKDYRLFFLHDFLIQFAVIAMFIGIFIQMIFEEKNVTES